MDDNPIEQPIQTKEATLDIRKSFEFEEVLRLIKKSALLAIVIGALSLGVVGALAWYFVLNKNLDSSINDNSSSAIAKICKNNPKIPRQDIIPGSVSVNFKNTDTKSDILAYLAQGNITGYESDIDEVLNLSGTAEVVFQDSFLRQNAITVQEISNFISNLSKEPGILNIIPGYILSSSCDGWPKCKSQQITVARWGSIRVVVKDQEAMDKILKKYPEATLITNPHKPQPENIVFSIIYKASPFIKILIDIAREAGYDTNSIKIGDGSMVYTSSDPMPRPIIDMSWTPMVTFPSNLSIRDIHLILQRYPEIDAEHSKIRLHVDNFGDERPIWVGIPVPVGQEDCWVRELEKSDLVKNAGFVYPLPPT